MSVNENFPNEVVGEENDDGIHANWINDNQVNENLHQPEEEEKKEDHA